MQKRYGHVHHISFPNDNTLVFEFLFLLLIKNVVGMLAKLESGASQNKPAKGLRVFQGYSVTDV